MPSTIRLTLATVALLGSSLLPSVIADASDRDFTWGNLPDTWQDGQTGE